ncbi:MAG: AMP-binding protein, partial [Deltaproteobacteria bacterium]|nr:AMP-binding protein [Deltaproteobacteria bacterium]
MIDWQSGETNILLNPRLSVERERQLRDAVQQQGSHLSGHVWIASSGTTGAAKLVALSKEAILCSAAAVNRHLESNASDRWCLALPTFHVGGLGILARAYVSGADVMSLDVWDPKQFVSVCRDKKCTLTSLVPTQLYDLVRASTQAPPSLRAVIIGGGRLAPELAQRALDLGWPVLPSYGLTECASQAATAPVYKVPPVGVGLLLGGLRILEHVTVESRNGVLCFKGKMLFSGYLIEKHSQCNFMNPMKDGWFVSDDRGEVQGDTLIVHGRAGDIVKVCGENVDVGRLQEILQEVMLREGFKGDAAVVAVPDERLGNVIHVLVDTVGARHAVPLQDIFNTIVM